MSPFTVATAGGGTRISKGKTAGIGVMVLSAWVMIVPFINSLLHIHIPVPVVNITDLWTNAYNAVIAFAGGLGIWSIRDNQ